MKDSILYSFQEGNTYVYTQDEVDRDKRFNSYIGKFLSKENI